jgi:hypothetical protein
MPHIDYRITQAAAAWEISVVLVAASGSFRLWPDACN